VDHESIKKYFEGDSTPEEVSALLNWLFTKKGEEELFEAVDVAWDEMDSDFQLKEHLLSDSDKRDKPRIHLLPY
jgi:hypothetical protein